MIEAAAIPWAAKHEFRDVALRRLIRATSLWFRPTLSIDYSHQEQSPKEQGISITSQTAMEQSRTVINACRMCRRDS